MAATRMTETFGHGTFSRMPAPEDNSAIVVYMASDAASGINGQTIACFGNRISLYTPNPVIVDSIETETRWTVEELVRVMPGTLEKKITPPEPPRTPGK